MAIVFDSIGTAQNNAASAVISWAHTITNNTNSVLLAHFSSNVTNPQSINASPQFAGQNLTKIITGTNTDDARTSELWYLINPPAGLGTINGTWSNSTASDKTGISVVLTGVNQVSPIVGSTRFIGTIPTSGSVTTTLGANNWFTGGIYLDTGPGTTNIGNERGTVRTALNGLESIFADSTGGTLRWTFPGADVVLLGAEVAGIGGSLARRRRGLGV